VKCSACSPTPGPTATCGKSISSLCANAARHRAAARSRNRSEYQTDSQCGIELCGGIDATLALAARSVVGSRGAGERSAARHFSQTGVSLERGSGQPRQTTERPSGRRRSRTGGRLRVSPLTRCRATLKLYPYRKAPAANFVPNPARSLSVPLDNTERALRHVSPAPLPLPYRSTHPAV
jgi:hypothetical protein